MHYNTINSWIGKVKKMQRELEDFREAVERESTPAAFTSHRAIAVLNNLLEEIRKLGVDH